MWSVSVVRPKEGRKESQWKEIRLDLGYCEVMVKKSGMIAGIKVEEEIIRDLKWLDIELYVRGQHGYWASLRHFKIEHQRASGLLQPLDIPVWKWDEISMDFVTGLPWTQRRHDAIWVVVDRLTKLAYFLPIRKDYSVSRLAEIFNKRSYDYTDMLRSYALEWTGNWDDYICLVEFAYNNSWHASIKCAPFEMLYGRKCRAPICWDQVGERVIEGPEMIEVTNKKVVVAKEKLKEARTRQESYVDKHRRALEF
nr:retrotransposon protein, putative, Ty3-gypsy subclass [Tanacetum cinerariifolium]